MESSRQLVLPVLIGCSLTGVGLALVYYFYKKNEGSKGGRKSHVESSRPMVITCKVPRQFVPAVIGRGGSIVKEIQSLTGTQIHFETDNIELPYRICTIKGSPEGTKLAEAMIQNVIVNQPIIETYEMYIPEKACKAVIGRGGENVQLIQLRTSAKVIIDRSYSSNNQNADRRVIIKGTAEQIAAALSQIEDKVREENENRSKLAASSTSRLPRGKLSPRNTINNSSEHLSRSTESPLTKGTAMRGLMEVYVSAMHTPSQFWVQVVGPDTIALDKLVAEMTDYYVKEENRELHVLKNVTVGQIVAAKFIDNRWYRAEVSAISEDGHCKVYYADYGDQEEVDSTDVLDLRTDFLSLRLQAIECCLANVKARDNEWSVEACDRFADLTWLAQWKVLIAKVRGYNDRTCGYERTRREGSPIPCVELYDNNDNKDINVGKELISEGLAESEEGTWSAASSTLSLSKRSYDISPASVLTSTSSAGKGKVFGEKTSTLTAPETIDLRTPTKNATKIVDIDLTTPTKADSNRFINDEKKAVCENGSGDCALNGKHASKSIRVDTSQSIAPGGYESDLSAASDELEIG